MTALAHTADCTGVALEHFGAPEREHQPWPHTTRCLGCGAQRVLRVEPERDLFGSPLIDPAPAGVPTIFSFA